jgi:hypothetical protein
MIAKFDKYWKQSQGPMGLATILDPRFKTDFLLGFIETLTCEPSDVYVEKLGKIKESLCELKEYELDEGEDNIESSTPHLPIQMYSLQLVQELLIEGLQQ